MNTKITYPIDADEIFKNRKKMRRALLENSSLQSIRVAILAGSTSEELKNVLEIFLLNSGYRSEFFESDFNRYYETILFDNSELQEFKPDLVYIFTSVYNIRQFPVAGESESDFQNKVDLEFSRLKEMWQKANDLLACPVIQNNFEFPNERVLGNLDAQHRFGKVNFVQELNYRISEYSENNSSLLLCDINYLSAKIGLQTWFDNRFWYSYKYAMSFNSIVELAKNLNAIIVGIKGRSKKCLVCDLDNTLWGGVIGDDGPEGIRIGSEFADAEAFTAFQSYILQLKQRGVVLAICSKNDLENAKLGFTADGSVLKLEDFSAVYANWDLKSDNIKAIAEELSLGLDSFVFIDDNPAECELVRSQLPMVEVVHMGTEPDEFVEILDSCSFFEVTTIGGEDLARTESYKQNKQRAEQSKKFENYDEFLKSLEMKAVISAFDEQNKARIVQLINKTNQFNLTTKRYTSEQVNEMMLNDSYITLYGKLTDKFGDNGLVSIVVAKQEKQTLEIDLWLMSCRVLKRGLEHAMYDQLLDIAQKNNIESIQAKYIKTQKNSMVEKFYQDLNFKCVQEFENGDSVWELQLGGNTDHLNKVIEVQVG